MNGAVKFYNIIKKAYQYNIGELIKINCAGYGEGYKYKNILFILSEHARGKTLRIWIYENEEITDFLNNEHLEVYGIIDGLAGWTESYGWTEQGSWVDYIRNYFLVIEEQIYKREFETEIKVDEINEQKEKLRLEKINKFDKLFYS